MKAFTVTVKPEPPVELLASCQAAGIMLDTYVNRPNIGLVPAYHKLWEQNRDEDILIYIHDDVTIHDPEWLARIQVELLNRNVAIVGFGGATGIGHQDLYKVPYRIDQLVRYDYRSNQTDWETHGGNHTGDRRVAVVDGYLMAMQGGFLEQIRGWDWIDSAFHCYDTAMCLMAARLGYEVRTAGVSCTHQGGGTSISKEYEEWCENKGTTPTEEHANPHYWLYNEFRDVLPLRI